MLPEVIEYCTCPWVPWSLSVAVTDMMDEPMDADSDMDTVRVVLFGRN